MGTTNINYFESFENNIKKHSINLEEIEADYKLERELIKQDVFEEYYKKFFVDGVLKSLIEGYIKSISIKNVQTAREPKEFEFVLVEEVNGENKGLGRTSCLSYRTTINYKTTYGSGRPIELKGEVFGYTVDSLIRYLSDVLNAKIYEMEEVKFSKWVTAVPKRVTHGGPWNRPESSYERKEIGISFKCSIKQLINMYYLECLRYLNIHDAKEYNVFLEKNGFKK